jgi:uncharacterized repeat protein (TIGR03803 family)
LAVVSVAQTTPTYEIVHAFRDAGQAPYGYSESGGESQSGLILASDGYFYGTTYGGGSCGVGTVFRVDSAGNLTTVHSFAYADGANPRAGLLQASDGELYGTTTRGGANNLGIIFKMTLAGTVTRLHSFDGTDGKDPLATVVQASDGNFYGTTSAGGANTDSGTVFRITASGDFTSLHSFDRSVDSCAPMAELIQAADGFLYGTTFGDVDSGGTGSIFRVDSAGQVTTFHTFNGFDGRNPTAPLLQASDGNMYGTTEYGGNNTGPGTVFKINAAGELTTLHTFTSGEDAQPRGGLLQGADGNFYGTTWGGESTHGAGQYGTVFRLTASGEFFTLHTFSSTAGFPLSALVQGADGALYGTTNPMWPEYSDFNQVVPGTIFRLETSGDFATLHTFGWEDGALFAYLGTPGGPALVQNADGDFYGKTAMGGTSNLGTVFRLRADGGYQILHNFDPANGSIPTGLMQASDGNFYGSTWGVGPADWGTVFRMTPDGQVTTMHAFQYTDGEVPSALMQSGDDTLKGAAMLGGPLGGGTLFSIHFDGSFEVFAYFDDSSGSYSPNGPLVQGDRGTNGSGGSAGCGGTFSGGLLGHDFDPQIGDGCHPRAGLTDIDGTVLGTTSTTIFEWEEGSDAYTWHYFTPDEGGGTEAPLVYINTPEFTGIYGTSYTTIYRVDWDHSVHVLHTFSGIGGSHPTDAMVQGLDGNIYGMANAGPFGAFGAEVIFGAGVIFRLTNSQIAVNEVSPSSGSGEAGAALTVLGGGFTSGATVTVGGTAGTDVTILDPTFLYLFIPALSPGTLNDVTVTNPGSSPASATHPKAYFADFLDVTQTDPFHDFVEKIFRAGITAGCGGGSYCPDEAVTRAQMAVFLLKAEHGSGYVPPACTGVFGDVTCPSMFADWIEQLAHEGITAGCGGGNYCPSTPVTRAQMAVFLLKAEHGAGYAPPACTGVFADVTCPSLFADWIEQLAAEGITGGCGGGNYCPNNPNTRAQMAVFLTKTFHL